MRYSTIPSSLFADRRDMFMRKMTAGSLAIFCSNGSMPRSGDQYFPFRQDSDLFALSGLDQAGSILILCPDAHRKADREIALILPLDPEHAIWNGERYSAREAARISGISNVQTIDHLDRILDRLTRDASTIYEHSADQGRHDTDMLSPNDQMGRMLRERFPDHTFKDSYQILSRMMMIKHPEELQLMRQAVAVSGKAFDRILETTRPGMKEYQLEAELTSVLIGNGCQHAFEPIIASGKSACILHYIRNDRILQKEDLVLLDFGAEYACMASDISRTIPVSGRFTKRQRDIYHSVQKILDEVTAMMRPGITLTELNKATGTLVERELLRLRIITKNDLRRQDPAAPIRRKYFMHGVSHHLGYDVHDQHERTAPLKAGMVLTCEPGLYIPEEGIGIRLENDILITRGKPKNLMEGIPIDPEEIEDRMHQSGSARR